MTYGLRSEIIAILFPFSNYLVSTVFLRLLPFAQIKKSLIMLVVVTIAANIFKTSASFKMSDFAVPFLLRNQKFKQVTVC